MNHLSSYFSIIIISFLSAISININAQVKQGNLTGIITTSDNLGADAVTVELTDLAKSTLTSADGSYTLRNIKPGTYTLRISFVGLKPQEKAVTVLPERTVNVDFVMAESSAQLAEVLIVSSKSANEKPVTIGKIAINPFDMPQSVATINSETISNQQAGRLSDVMKNVNGVAFSANRGSVSGETFFARGYSLGANNLFKNGARTSSGGMPEVSTLESVEVIKGSAALLYGGVTGGAVVNMVTKKPKFTTGGEISMRSGSYDLYKPTGDIYGAITKNLAFRVIGTLQDAGSFRDHVSSKRLYVNPSLLYKLGENTEVIVQGDYLKSDYTPDFGIGTVGNKLVDAVGRNTYLNTIWAYNKTNTTTSQVSINHKLNNNWKLDVNASILSYNRNYFGGERPFADENGVAKRDLTRSKIQEYTYNQQINVNGSFNTGSIAHMLLIGADADQSVTNAGGFIYPGNNNLSSYSYGNINLFDPSTINARTDIPETIQALRTKTPVNRMGVFVQDLVSVTHNFKVLAGLRYTRQKTGRTTIDSLLTNKSIRGAALSKTDNAFSPKLGLIYQPLKTTSLYVSYANNFITNSGVDINDVPMAPSTVDQYEAGIKNDLLGGKLSANITWYKIANNNFAQMALFKADGTVNSDSNVKEFSGQTASDGIELDLNGTVIRGLNFMAGYSYNFIRYTKTIANTGIVEGERLVGSIKNTANGSLFYTVGSGQVKGLKLGASAFYTGDRNGGRNTNKAGTSSGIIPLKSFTTLDFSAGYSFKKVSILAKVSNLTNELNYFVHENYSVNPIDPRQFTTTLSYKF